MGFHNPDEALRILQNSADLARQCQMKSAQAAGDLSLLQDRRLRGHGSQADPGAVAVFGSNIQEPVKKLLPPPSLAAGGCQ